MLAIFYNALPIRWQRRILDRTQARFLVGVVGLGVDPNGHVILARHRFGAPEWRFLGGFLSPRERLEDALAREVREETGIDIGVGPHADMRRVAAAVLVVVLLGWLALPIVRTYVLVAAHPSDALVPSDLAV